MKYCAMLLVKYRAKSLGLRRALPTRSIYRIQRSFCIGIGLLAFMAATTTLRVVNRRDSLTHNEMLDSLAACTGVVGVILALAPVNSALIMQSPVHQPPPPEELGEPRS